MPLSRQLLIGLIGVLSIMFIGTLWTEVNNTRQYIDQQLTSHAQDTATSLGLSVSPYLGKDDDLPTIDAMMNAIFDSGYYQSMTLTDLNGNKLITKTNPATSESVPNWFASFFPLSPPIMESQINSGWQLVATLSIQSHPGMGYDQLWSNAKQAFVLTFSIFIVSVLIGAYLVRLITKPIRAVVLQANEIAKGQFTRLNSTPKTKEISALVKAINSMSLVLEKMFQQLSKQAENYSKIAFTDGLTDLGNRRAFDMHMNRLLNDKKIIARGYLYIIRLSSLAQVNQSQGRETADIYIQDISTITQDTLSDESVEFDMYRIGGSDFVAVIEDIDDKQAQHLASELMSRFQNNEKSYYEKGSAHIGFSAFRSNDSLPNLMERADSALMLAGSEEKGWAQANQVDIIQSNVVWRQHLNNIIDNKTADLVLQPVLDSNQDTLYQECFARLSIDNGVSYLPMGQLIPASERLNYSHKIDQLVIEQVLSRLPNNDRSIGINISAASMANSAFREWLVNRLMATPSICRYVVIEMGLQTTAGNINNCLAFANALKELGCRITLQDYGTSMADMKFLPSIKPDFVKVDGRFVRDIDKHEDTKLYVQSLVNIAHSLNVLVIAEMVETQAEIDTLNSIYVDCLQGYFLGKPKHWSDKNE